MLPSASAVVLLGLLLDEAGLERREEMAVARDEPERAYGRAARELQTLTARIADVAEVARR